MSSNVLDGRSVVLRLEFSIADAVRQRGLVPVIGAAVRAWWAMRPVSYDQVPAYLREDVGLPSANEPAHWSGIDLHSYRLHPPNRKWP
jgi:hypothetical protein